MDTKEILALFDEQVRLREPGLYRATVARRAELAREHGYGRLNADAPPTSRPILERLGFVAITTTTPSTFPA